MGWELVSIWEYSEWRRNLFNESASASAYALSVAFQLRAEYNERGFVDWTIDEDTLAYLEFEYDFPKEIDSEEIVLKYMVFYLRLPNRSFVDGDLLERIKLRLQEIDYRSTHGNRPRFYLSLNEAFVDSMVLEDDLKIHIGDYDSSFEGNGSKTYSIFAHQIVLKDKASLAKFQSTQSSIEETTRMQ